MKIKTLNTKELAEILRCTPESLRTKIWRVRKGLEPATAIPPYIQKSGRPLWLYDDVKRWLVSDSNYPCTSSKTNLTNKGGRPRKSLPSIKI